MCLTSMTLAQMCILYRIPYLGLCEGGGGCGRLCPRTGQQVQRAAKWVKIIIIICHGVGPLVDPFCLPHQNSLQ